LALVGRELALIGLLAVPLDGRDLALIGRPTLGLGGAGLGTQTGWPLSVSAALSAAASAASVDAPTPKLSLQAAYMWCNGIDKFRSSRVEFCFVDKKKTHRNLFLA